jgi:hypothetical protein
VKKLAPIIDSMVIGQDRVFLRRNFMGRNQMHDEITFDEFMDVYVMSKSAASGRNTQHEDACQAHQHALGVGPSPGPCFYRTA